MRVYFATTHHGMQATYRAFREEAVGDTLLSYAYREVEPSFHQVWARPGSRVLFDSGAFTAHTCGEAVRLADYFEWTQDLSRRWGHRLAEVRFFNLDVINDQEATWRNHTELRTRGLATVPILTPGASAADFDRAVWEARDCGNVLALGGLVAIFSANRWGDALRVALDRAFSLLMPHIAGREPDRILRVHLLGITQPHLWRRYPCASADSSTHDNVIRFGCEPGRLGRGCDRMPKLGTSMEINVLALRERLRRTSAAAAAATALWERRGICF